MSSPTPLIQINLFEHTTTLTRSENGKLCTYPIDLTELALQLTDTRIATGFLPSSVIAWALQQQRQTVLWYVPRAIYALKVIRPKHELSELTVPLPAAILLGQQKQYRLFAVHRRPTSASTRLYHFPSPNVDHTGSICNGSTVFPAASIATMQAAWQAFITSAFNNHLANGCCQSETDNVLTLWQSLDAKKTKRFPKDELVEHSFNLATLIPTP